MILFWTRIVLRLNYRLNSSGFIKGIWQMTWKFSLQAPRGKDIKDKSQAVPKSKYSFMTMRKIVFLIKEILIMFSSCPRQKNSPLTIEGKTRTLQSLAIKDSIMICRIINKVQISGANKHKGINKILYNSPGLRKISKWTVSMGSTMDKICSKERI